MSLCKHCVSGVRHEGTPEGKWEKINGVDCYVATPTVEYAKEKALLFLTDIFGPQLINNQLLADDFARNGFRCIIPDMFEGDPAPEDALESGTFNIAAWFVPHGPHSARPLVDKVIAALKEEGVTSIATAGYCYGARISFDLAYENIASVTVASHPSLLQVPQDIIKYKASKAPLLLNTCTTDPQFPIPAQQAADMILGNGQFEPGYERTYWEGCTHGFSVRGDIKDPKVKEGKEGAFKASVDFLFKYF
ncbi:alpha/beta-hydrolase [Cristinia sonorae]|uniref:Alpha/beta-hydrolase n=1 Tax=Cristinia sonorae TaxID=1940300 RepID=A0A8K0UUV4_9AGAR|nr:alpha/beta-hydrolase [Cristinia sonorae]